jgi:hypothetical protein
MEDAMARKTGETINLRVRMPEALRTTIAVEAAKAGRSLNSEILYRLGLTLDEKWQRFVAGVEEQEHSDQELLDRALENPKLQETLRNVIARMRKKER